MTLTLFYGHPSISTQLQYYEIKFSLTGNLIIWYSVSSYWSYTPNIHLHFHDENKYWEKSPWITSIPSNLTPPPLTLVSFKAYYSVFVCILTQISLASYFIFSYVASLCGNKNQSLVHQFIYQRTYSQVPIFSSQPLTLLTTSKQPPNVLFLLNSSINQTPTSKNLNSL